ncbi:MAG: RpiB/LacA/LacB family sugar-phosphate isomerase [Myxococcales bacterium]|nr:RpiB/LacA/LacB family sugar-phosphate isomerase [Myxococcales bacterium]
MRIAVASDEWSDVDGVIVLELERLGHSVWRGGAAADRAEHPWVTVAAEAAGRVVGGEADEGILLCWTGTGVCIAANKLPGVRAALCSDAQTAAAARVWNHANVLCLAHRTLTPDLAREILTAWLAPYDMKSGAEGVVRLAVLDPPPRG